MEFEKEETYRRFLAYIKIELYRENCKEEKSREKVLEYRDTVNTLEMIRNRRHLALLGETNEEKILYSQILDKVYEMYKDITILDDNYDQQSKKLYQEVSKIIGGYQMKKDKKTKKEENNKEKTGEEER